MASLDDLRALGYSLRPAQMDDEQERKTLDELLGLRNVAPDVVDLEATRNSLREALAQAQKSRDPRLAQIADQLTAAGQVLAVRQGLDDEIALQERAVAIAEAAPTVYRIEGWGTEGYIDETQTETINDLADPAKHRWRRWQQIVDRKLTPAQRSRLLAAVRTLQGKGYRLDIDLQDDGTGLVAIAYDLEGDEVGRGTTLAQIESAANSLPDLTPEP